MEGMRTWVEIDRSALLWNFDQFRRVFPKNVQIAPVIKANAYGHEALLVAQTLGKRPIWGFCVASGEEALGIRGKYRGRLLVMTSWQRAELPVLIRQGVSLAVWDRQSADQVATVARRISQQARIHVKIDTGAGRIGVRPEQYPALITSVQQQTTLMVEGIFSHFASSEEQQDAFTRDQIAIFRHATQLAPEVPWRHVACTAAALRFTSSRFNLIRPGIGTYGLWPSTLTRQQSPRVHLKPVLSWRSKILQIKRIPAGTSVSYGRSFRVRRQTQLGVVPVGYWDGYDRGLGNRGCMLVHGRRVRVLGRICMNLSLIDCTNIPNVRAGDRVTLIGRDGQASVTAEELAKNAQTINYEIVARINPLIPRIPV